MGFLDSSDDEELTCNVGNHGSILGLGRYLRERNSQPLQYPSKFRFKLKKVGKTPRPIRYDLNQIPYDYTLEVTNRFMRLDLVYRIP